MNIEGIMAIVSLGISGAYIIYKLINKVKKSNCVVVDKDGEKFEIDFNDIKKTFEEAEKVYNKELNEKEREVLRKIMDKSLNEITSPKANKKNNLTL